MAKLIGNAPNQVPTNADLGSMAFEDRTNYANISSPIYQPFRNIIINGDMSIAQRGTSETGITSSGYYTCDRWRLGNATSGTWTQSQSTDVPNAQGFQKSTKLDCTTANASLGTGNILYFQQIFEGQNLQYLKKGTANAESLTVSFWVKSNKTGTYIAELYDNDNSRQISKSYTINSANTWEKKTITYAGDTSGAIDNDNTAGLTLNFWLVAGTNHSSGTLSTTWTSNTNANANRAVGQLNLADSTSNEWYITGVQLEAGTTASDFEFLPYDVNLQRCQRYYQIFGGTALSFYQEQYISGTVFLTGNARHIVNMRSAPSVSLTGNWFTVNMTGSSPTFVINDNNFTTYWQGGSTGRALYHLSSSSTLNFNSEL